MENTFTEGKILSKLLKFSLPVLFALFLQAAYGAVDLLVVGQFGTNSDISGVSTGSQLMHSITSIMIGFSMGTTIILGMKIGEKKEHEATNVIGTCMTLFSIIAVILTLLIVIFSEQLCMLMNAPADAFKESVDYVRICGFGLIFIIAYNILGSIFRGLGDSKTPLLTAGIACVINITADLILVSLLEMGAKGAAIATVFSQAISVVITIIILKYKNIAFFKIKKSDLKLDKQISKDIIRLGGPIALQDGLVSISFLVVLSIVNNLGLEKSAGVGVAEKLCAFILLVPSSFMQSISAFVSQNMGANKYNRAKKALMYGIITSLCFATVLFYLSFFHGQMLAGIFSSDVIINEYAASYLKAYAIDTILTSFLFCLIGFFNGTGETRFVMIQGIIGAFFVRIPVSFIMSNLENVTLFKVGLATPISTVVQIILCLIYLVIINKKYNKVPKQYI